MININLTKGLIGSLICLLFSTASLAGFEPGFLVTYEGDTLHGAIKFGSSGIKLKPLHGGKTQIYSLGQISAYAYNEEGIVHYNFEDLFYRQTIDGEVQLYERTSYTYSYNGQFTTTIVQNSYAVKHREEEQLMLLRMTNTIGRGKMYFVDQASSYFHDYPALVSEIQSGSYNKGKNIGDMVSRYNDWWDSQQ